MTQITYFSIGASLSQYNPAAFSYISFEKDRIIDVANKIGLPISTGIAGAMAEEFSGQNLAQSQATDFIARYYIPLIDLIMAFTGSTSTEGIDWNAINLDWNSVYSSLRANQANYSLRTNQDWIDDYNYVVANHIDVTQLSNAEKYFQKFVHPALNDFGPANFNLATAIHLINDTPANLLTTLGLAGYQNNYSQLAIDLSKDEQGITAKLYGLMIKEADTWFTAKNAYGSDWVSLPQEIKDALYITYVNLGHDKMEQRFNEVTFNGTYSYEPLPALGTAGGLNHLNNAAAIATSIGATGYGDIAFISDPSSWLTNAKLDNALGAAYREALVKLYPFVVFDNIYEGGVEFRDNFTDEYLQDRTEMLVQKITLRNEGVLPDITNTLFGNGSQNAIYIDLPSQQKVELGTGEIRIVFGGQANDNLEGVFKGDHLYGGAGNDTLSGNGGNDYLEGGQGSDTYIYTSGDGFDTIVDTDGLGAIQLDGNSLNSATLKLENIYTNDITGYTVVKVDGGNSLVIRKMGVEGGILVKDWSEAKKLGINLQGTLPSPPEATLAGDFKKKIDDHGTSDTADDTYVMTDGNYTPDESAPGGEVDALDLISGTAGNDVIDGKGGHDALSGKAGDDHVEGGTGVDIIQGGMGNDTLNGGAGDDALYGSSDQELIKPTEVNFIKPVNTYPNPQATGFNWTKGYYSVSENGVPFSLTNVPRNRLAGDQGNVLDGGAGNDFIAAGTGADYAHGGADNDYIYGMDKDDILFGDAGNDLIFGDGDKQSVTSVVWSLPENHGDDIIDGGDGFDILYGQGGNDIIFGGEGNDKIWGDDNDSVELPSDRNGNDYVDAGIGNDTVVGGGKDDTLIGGAGNDSLLGDNANSNLALEFHGNDYLDGGAGIDTLYGGGGNDTLLGGSDNDTLYGNEGNDRLDGGTGVDLLVGGAGDDVYLNVTGEDTYNDTDGHSTFYLAANNIGAGGMVITNYGDQGQYRRLDVAMDNGNTLKLQDAFYGSDATLQFANGNKLDLETLVGSSLNSALNLSLGDEGGRLYSGAGADTLYGGLGNDTLSGHRGNDTLVGGAGDDTYVYNLGDGMDTIYDAGGNNDVLRFGAGILPAQVTLSRNIFSNTSEENVTLSVPNTNQSAAENVYNLLHLKNYFNANNSANRIDRIEFEDGTVWTYADIKAKASVTPTDSGQFIRGYVDNDVIDALGGNDNIRGLSGDDTLMGGAGNDTIEGGKGNDSLEGGDGNDSLTGYGISGGDDFDALNEVGNDTLYGGVGDDVMQGGYGADVYLFGRGDGFDKALDGGQDTLIDTLRLGTGVLPQHVKIYGSTLVIDESRTQIEFSGIERIEFDNGSGPVWSAADIDIHKVPFANVNLTGSSGNDTFNIGYGGGTITEALNGGIDTVLVSASYTLPANVENITLTGPLVNIDASGNDLNNVLIGNAGDNDLGGRAGNDTMQGGLGDDTYYVENENDVVIENANEGIDTVYADLLYNKYSYTLGANVENLSFYHYGGAVGWPTFIWGTGNDLDNILKSPSGSGFVVTLDGKAGADIIAINGSAVVIAYIDNQGDKIIAGYEPGVIYLDQKGAHIIYSSIDYTINQKLSNIFGVPLNINISNNLALNGNNAITGIGNDSNNNLSSYENTAANILKGGLGDDNYFIGLNDTVIEQSGEGRDTVYLLTDLTNDSNKSFRVSDFGFANVEDFVLAGSARDASLYGDAQNNKLGLDLDSFNYSGKLYGDAGNDTLNGGASNDFLDGGIGADSMAGGAGDDIYIVDNVGDIVYESSTHLFYRTSSWNKNTLFGAYDNDVFTLSGGKDTILASVSYAIPDYSLVEKITLTGTANINATGNSLNNIIIGNDSVNNLIGGAGVDQLNGNGGNDSLDGGNGNDQLNGNAGDDYMYGGTGNDTLEGGEGSDTYYYDRGWGQDYLSERFVTTSSVDIDTIQFAAGIAASDILVERVSPSPGSAKNDLKLSLIGTTDTITVADYFYGAPNDARQIEKIRFSDNTVWDIAAIIARLNIPTSSDDILYGTAQNDTINGLAGDDEIFGLVGNDTLLGGTENDILFGDEGSDTYIFERGWGQDYVSESFVRMVSGELDTIQLGAGIAPSDIAVTRNSSDLILTIIGTSDTVTVGNYFAYEGIQYNNKIEKIRFADNTVWDVATEAAKLNVATSLDDFLDGTASNDTINGLAGNDEIYGLGGSDVINGGDGDDYIDGDLDSESYPNAVIGNDSLYGGNGDDSIYGLDGDDQLNGDAGSDYVIGGNGNDSLNGGSGADYLDGESGNDRLDGGSGIDTMFGRFGDDTFVVDSLLDDVVEELDEGIDTVESTLTFDLASIANIENLKLIGTGLVNATGNSFNNVLTGNSAANTLIGAAGNDRLIGGAGNDTMKGGTGNDIYVVDVMTDVITELTDEGTDTVESAITFSLSAISNVENVLLTGAAAINATGNTLANILTGNSAANTLDGGTGIDTLIGAAGNDIYIVDNTLDVVTENLNEGTDLIQSSATYTLSANVENLTLTATGLVNGTGNTLSNILTGNSAVNTLSGGAGDDTYFITSGDSIVESLNEGTDTANAGFTYTLSANVENLTLTGTTAINGTGNALNNIITGNSAINTLTGGAGDDTYFITSGDIVTEAASAGIDTVNAGFTYTLAANVENLILTGTTAINGTGNTLNNILTGNGAVNTLAGGTGNDTYIISTGDIVTEAASAGTDTVQTNITYTLGSNVENLTLTGTGAINGTGNSLINLLIGNSGANILAGGLGNDTLTGGSGADQFLFDTAINATTNKDIITDFSVVDDTIRLENAIFTKFTTTGTLAAGTFVSGAGAKALDANDFLIYNTTTGTLSYDADGNGAGAQVDIVTLTGIPALTTADFTII